MKDCEWFGQFVATAMVNLDNFLDILSVYFNQLDKPQKIIDLSSWAKLK